MLFTFRVHWIVAAVFAIFKYVRLIWELDCFQYTGWKTESILLLCSGFKTETERREISWNVKWNERGKFDFFVHFLLKQVVSEILYPNYSQIFLQS